MDQGLVNWLLGRFGAVLGLLLLQQTEAITEKFDGVNYKVPYDY